MPVRRLVDGAIAAAALAAVASVLTGGAVMSLADVSADFTRVHTAARVLAILLIVRVMCWPHAGSATAARVGRWFDAMSGRPWIAVAVLMVTFGALFAAHVLRHWTLGTDLFDVVPVHQVLFYPWKDGLLRCDVCYNGTYLAEHFVYSFLWLTPITASIGSDELLFLLQVLLLVVPICVVLRYGPLANRRDAWLIAVLLIVAHRAMRGAAEWDLREDEIAFASLLCGLVAIYRSRAGWYVVCLLTAMLSKENVPVITMFLAVPILWSPVPTWNARTRRALAAVTIAASAVWLVVCFVFLAPYYAGATEPVILGRLPGMGSTPGEILVTLLTSPRAWWHLLSTRLLTYDAARYLLYLLAPFALFFRGRHLLVWLAPAVPAVLMNAISELPLQRAAATHYDLTVLPFLIFALALGLSGARRWTTKEYAVGLVAAWCFSGSSVMWNIREAGARLDAELSESRFLRTLPNAGTIAATNGPLAQLTAQRDLRQVFIPTASSRDFTWDEFVAVNTTDRTGIPGHGVMEATRVVVNRAAPAEVQLERLLVARNWTTAAESPKRRFAVLIRPAGTDSGLSE